MKFNKVERIIEVAYTGGSIWCVYGQLKSGEFFVADSSEMWVTLYDSEEKMWECMELDGSIDEDSDNYKPVWMDIYNYIVSDECEPCVDDYFIDAMKKLLFGGEEDMSWEKQKNDLLSVLNMMDEELDLDDDECMVDLYENASFEITFKTSKGSKTAKVHFCANTFNSIHDLINDIIEEEEA